MNQTPMHDKHNPDLLSIIPPQASSIIEIGCSSGALAREFKKMSPHSTWLGVEINPEYAAFARQFCDETLVANIEECDFDFYRSQQNRDCWIFGDTLEHLKDPWAVIGNIRKVIPEHGCIAACVPNAQHWSVVVRLATGQFRYESSGLLDRTHLRWFTRATLIELFQSQGFKIIAGKPRIFKEAQRDRYLPLIADLAKQAGADADQVVKDSLPLQYVVRAVPV